MTDYTLSAMNIFAPAQEAWLAQMPDTNLDQAETQYVFATQISGALHGTQQEMRTTKWRFNIDTGTTGWEIVQNGANWNFKKDGTFTLGFYPATGVSSWADASNPPGNWQPLNYNTFLKAAKHGRAVRWARNHESELANYDFNVVPLS